MAYQNQHSHIFLVDVTSLGEVKYNRGVRLFPGALKECLDLAVVSSQTLIQCLGIMMTSQVGEGNKPTRLTWNYFRRRSPPCCR